MNQGRFVIASDSIHPLPGHNVLPLWSDLLRRSFSSRKLLYPGWQAWTLPPFPRRSLDPLSSFSLPGSAHEEPITGPVGNEDWSFVWSVIILEVFFFCVCVYVSCDSTVLSPSSRRHNASVVVGRRRRPQPLQMSINNCKYFISIFINFPLASMHLRGYGVFLFIFVFL